MTRKRQFNCHKIPNIHNQRTYCIKRDKQRNQIQSDGDISTEFILSLIISHFFKFFFRLCRSLKLCAINSSPKEWWRNRKNKKKNWSTFVATGYDDANRENVYITIIHFEFEVFFSELFEIIWNVMRTV